jgi:hypothetical protein
VVASVFDPAGLAVSRMRITSPPMFDGRKLLKKVASRNEASRVLKGRCTPCAASSRPHRHALSKVIAK